KLVINGGLGSNTVSVTAGTVSDLELSNVDVLQMIGGTLSQDEGHALSVQDLLLSGGTLAHGATITPSTVSLGGSLAFDLTLLDGAPSVGDNFDLVHYGSRSGNFATIDPPSLSTVNWDFRYDDPNYPT